MENGSYIEGGNHLCIAPKEDVERRLRGAACVFCGDRRSPREPVGDVKSSLGERICLCFHCERYVDVKSAEKALVILEERWGLMVEMGAPQVYLLPGKWKNHLKDARHNLDDWFKSELGVSFAETSTDPSSSPVSRSLPSAPCSMPTPEFRS